MSTVAPPNPASPLLGLPTYLNASANVPTTVSKPATKKPRLIGFNALVSPSFARTANTPAMDAITPIARAASGNTKPSAGLSPTELNAATPRMIDATRVTS